MNINWTVVNEEATASDKIYLCSLHIERSGGCAEKKGCSTCCHKMGTKRWASALSSLCGIREMKCFDSKYFAKNWVCTKYYGGEILCKKDLVHKMRTKRWEGHCALKMMASALLASGTPSVANTNTNKITNTNTNKDKIWIWMLKTVFPCHFCGKGFSGATIRDIGYQLDSQWDLSHPTFNLSLIV